MVRKVLVPVFNFQNVNWFRHDLWSASLEGEGDMFTFPFFFFSFFGEFIV
jgi:hypothetical protein